MVPVAAGPLTRISFRRDVRIFLTALVGFLGLLIFALLLELQHASREAQAGVIRRWNAVADAGALELAGATGETDRRLRAAAIADRYGIVEVSYGTAPEQEGRTVLVRRVNAQPVRFVFEEGELEDIGSRFGYTAAICIAAAVTGMVLLLFYLPRITRPIEAMMDDARQLGDRPERQDETEYLIATFRESISRLREQEGELKRLHEAEKSRADELEMVTATLTRSLSSGLIALDAEGRILELNAAAREVLSIPAARGPGLPLAELLGDTPLARAINDAIARRETLTRIEVEHCTPAATIEIGLTAVPLVGQGGRMLGMLALFTDLTPIKRLEQRVRAMQTLADLGEMAAGIVHELRNSLSTITGYVRLAQRSPLPDEAALRLRAAEEEAGQLQKAIERLLAFARPMELQIEPTSLRELVDGVVARLAPQAPSVAFGVHGDASVDADPALLARAVENVVRNAVEAVGENADGGWIEIAIASDPPSIAVSDNGTGIDPEQADRLLLPFVSEKPGGFGLGLSLARKIVMLHGGDLELRGAPGQGATVTMRLAHQSAERTAQSAEA